MKITTHGGRGIFRLLALVLLLGFPGGLKAAGAQAPDLTTVDLSTIDTALNYNLGPTGMRGWIYSHMTGYTEGTQGTTTSFQPWQILVVTVGANTPASGIMASNDVILGVSAGAASLPVPLFTSDARKSMGRAIGAAEAGDGKLNLKRWRGGVTTDVTLQLQVLGAYSATVPYNCPKSALILSNACNIIANRSFNAGVPGDPVLGLALLASGNASYLSKVRTYAYSIAPATLALRFAPGQDTSGDGLWVWGSGYKLVFLAEYYLRTSDTNVLHGINEYAVSLAQAQSRYGTMAHAGANLNADGSFHGTVGGYGPVNQGGLVGNLGIVLAKRCLVAAGMAVDPEIDPAIGRAAKFFGWYVQKGNIPYGEHEPWYYHAGNGKEYLTAVMFAMMGDQPVATEYWARMSVAGYNGLQYGHTGQGFAYLWSGMGVNVGGTNAMASYMAQVQWYLDLERRCDGSFVYDGQEQFGGSAVTDYWTVGGNNDYYGIDPTASWVLTYALPKQQLYVTGRNANPTNRLSSDQVTNAIWAGVYDQVVTGYNTNQLMSALGEYDPLVRSWAATQLGKLSTAAPLFPVLTNLVGSSTNPWVRSAACTALGAMGNSKALPVLVQALYDTDNWVRDQAARALWPFSAATVSPMLTNIMMAFTNNATDPNSIVWSDPVQIANGALANELFGYGVNNPTPNNLGSYLASTPTNLYYATVRTGLRIPDSNTRQCGALYAKNLLPLAGVKAVLPDLMACAAEMTQADTMWCGGCRAAAIQTLGKYYVAEALPLALSMLNVPPGDGSGTFAWNCDSWQVPAMNVLGTYGDAARWTRPSLNNYLNTGWGYDVNSGTFAAVQSAIASISSAVTTPAGLTNLFPVANPQVVNTTNAKAITLTGFSWRTNSVAFTSVTAPAHGTLSGTAPNLTYTPSGGYVGLDRFMFRVRDSFTNSDPATVSLIVGTPAGTGLKGEYYDNANFTNLKFTRTDPQVNFDWGSGSPSNTIAPTIFSVRWSGLLLAPESGNYRFSTLNSDGVRLYVNGVQVIDDWMDQVRQWTDGTPITLTAGQKYELTMDFFENAGDAVAKLKWTGPSFAGTNGGFIGKECLYDGTGVTNRQAIAYPQSVTMLQNTNQAITLEGAGNPPIYSIVTSPAHGTLTGTPPDVIYSPALNYSGADSFSFLVNNGFGNSAPATVSIAILAGQPVSFSWKSAASGYWSVAGNWTSGAPAAAGQPFYTLNFTPSGTYTVTNDLSNGFVLNQLNVVGAVTFGGANSLAFTANGALLPQINQNSASEVTFSAPLSLGAMTVVGGPGGGQLTIPSLISGAGGLANNRPSTLQINNAANTYSGGTIINSGILSLGLQAHRGLGTGPVTLNYWGTLMLERINATNALTLNGGTIIANNGYGNSFNSPVTLNSNTTVQANWNMAFGGSISGAAGLTKTGPNTLTLSGNNTFTGANFVTDGTLKCNNSAALGSGHLSISDGAVVNLNYTGTRQVASLTLGGTNQPAGTYGSTSSPATTKDMHFTGTGTVTVVAFASLTNSPASGITTTSATLNATLGCNGTNAIVYAYWSTVNGGNNAALWNNSAYIGSWTNVVSTNLSLQLPGLIPATTYFFTFRATNTLYDAWAPNVLSFATLTPPPPDNGNALLIAAGDNSFGQLTLPPAATNLVAIAAGAWHNLALRGDGQLIAWGNNYDGQCNVPANLRDAVAIAGGGYHSLALRLDGHVIAWGGNYQGQTNVPPGLSNVIAVAAGTWHSLALCAEGTVVGWGDNTSGQATPPVGLSSVVAIAAGGNHSLALYSDGTVAAWGENTDAVGNYAGQSVVPWGLTNVVAIAAGAYHSLAVSGDGSLALWGDNSQGQCSAPVGPGGAVVVAGGGSHTLALKADSTVAAWGSDWNSQCDLPPGLTNVVALAAGNSHSLVLAGIPPPVPLPLHPACQGTQFSLVAPTAAGRYYALEYKPTLAAPNWTSLTPIYGNGALQFLVDRNATGPQRFYRVRQW